MLIEYSLIENLDSAEKERLKQAATGLLYTYEATQGYVMFETRCYSAKAVKALIESKPQILKG